MNGTTLTALADSATADYQLQNDFCGLATLPEILYPQVCDPVTQERPHLRLSRQLSESSQLNPVSTWHTGVQALVEGVILT